MDPCTVQSCAQITQHDDIYIKFKSCLSNFFCNISYFWCFSILHICCKGCAYTKWRHSKSSRQAHPLLHVELCDVCETHSGRPPFLLTLRFEAKAAARLGQSHNSRGQVGEDACTHTCANQCTFRKAHLIRNTCICGDWDEGDFFAVCTLG